MAKLEDINAKLDYIEVTKQLIKQAIENKGQDKEDTDTFREFVNKISNIQTKSRFIENGPTSSSNCMVGDTFTYAYQKEMFKLGDFGYTRIDTSKLVRPNVSHQYIYKYGILEVINVEPISDARENITFKVIFIFQQPFPTFINDTVEERGLYYGNEATEGFYNWYSYEYSNLDVQSTDVLINKRFQGPTGVETGTMPNNGELNYTPTSSAQTIPAGYTSGGTISAMDITTSNDYSRCLALSKEILGIE